MAEKSPRDIVMAAYNHLSLITPPTQKISDVRIEELKSTTTDKKKQIWSVVLSYDSTDEYPFDKKREFKKFEVTKDAKVLSMISAKNE